MRLVREDTKGTTYVLRDYRTALTLAYPPT
jgi:hypothetical protein